MESRCYCEIHLSHLKHNLLAIQKCIPSKTKIMGIVKANAYGVGYYEMSKTLVEMGVKHLAVASLEEAIQLRNKKIDVDILILGHTAYQDIPLLKQYNLIQAVFSYEQAKILSQYQVRVHIKIDTGMSRMGFMYRQAQDYDIIKQTVQLFEHVEGIFTHFVVADSTKAEDESFTKHQITLFDELNQRLINDNLHIPFQHVQNSYGILNYPYLKYDFVRPGISLLGSYVYTENDAKTSISLKPVVTWKCRVASVKELESGISISYGRTYYTSQKCQIATITCGYADGYPRVLSNKGYVIINDHYCPIVGRICMDQMMVDVTNVPVKVDDEVILMGKSANCEIKAEDLAQLQNTITNDVYCMISSRVRRIYYD